MVQKYNVNFNLNHFFSNISLKKKYLNSLKNKSFNLSVIREKNHKILNNSIFNPKVNVYKYNLNNFLITYIVSISFLRSNTFVHVTDFSGKLYFFYSAGSFKQTGKNKKARLIVFKDIFQKLVSKLAFLKNKPLALHLQNIENDKF